MLLNPLENVSNPRPQSEHLAEKGSDRARHNANHTRNPYSDVREQDFTTDQFPNIQNSLPPQHFNHQSPYQSSYLPLQSPYDPLVPSSGSVPREDSGSFPVVSKKRIRTDAESEDDPEEPPRKSRRSTRRPMQPSKSQTQADAAIDNGSEGDENQSAPRKPSERKRSRRSKADIYKNHDDEGENEKEKRERKVSKYNQRIAEGKGPERGLLGPKGAVRIRDGQMEFKDLNNPKWSKPDSPFIIICVEF